MQVGLLTFTMLLFLCIGEGYARCRIRLWGTCILERKSGGKYGQEVKLPCKFKLLDTDSDGRIGVQEILTTFSGPDSFKYTTTLTGVMRALDLNGDQYVDRSEFSDNIHTLQQTSIFESC